MRLSILLLFSLLFGMTTSHAQDRRGAAFAFSATTHDFGLASTDTVLRHRFEFSNNGDAMLVINDAALSCPCFEVDWSRGPIQPGEKGWVDVAYPTTAKPGRFDKLIWLSSNAVNNPAGLDKFELRIAGTVVKGAIKRPKVLKPPQAALKIEQAVLDLGDIRPGEAAVGQITIRNTGNSPLHIERIIGSDGGVLASFPPGPVAPGKAVAIRIDVRREAEGPFSKTFNVLSNAVNGTDQWPGRTFIVKGWIGSRENFPKKTPAGGSR